MPDEFIHPALLRLGKVDIVWDELFIALALVLVIEGIMPFVSPHSWRNTMLQASQLPDKVLRIIGLGSMLLGVFLLYMLH